MVRGKRIVRRKRDETPHEYSVFSFSPTRGIVCRTVRLQIPISLRTSRLMCLTRARTGSICTYCMYIRIIALPSCNLGLGPRAQVRACILQDARFRNRLSFTDVVQLAPSSFAYFSLRAYIYTWAPTKFFYRKHIPTEIFSINS